MASIFKIRNILTSIKQFDVTTTIPNYEPAIMGYLVNKQKIGEREIYSTLFDLIGKKVVKITLKKGEVSSNNSEYEFTYTGENKGLNEYEKYIIYWLFEDDVNPITQEDIKNKIHNEENSLKNFNYFQKKLQIVAKRKDFFNKKISKTKATSYHVIHITTFIMDMFSKKLIYGVYFLSYLYVVFGVSSYLGVNIGETQYNITTLFIGCVLPILLSYFMKLVDFLVTYFYNICCYYNEYSENGLEDYKKWMGFKTFLNDYTLMKENPLMSVVVWERYYAYAIELKCSSKFFEQVKGMNLTNDSIDVALVEFYEFLINNIKESALKDPKSISTDVYGGSHVDY